MKKIILYWLPMPVMGMINGILRGAVYGEALGEPLAHQVSAVTLILLLLIYGLLVRTRLDLVTTTDAFLHGIIWTSLTVCFEFILGYWIFRQPMNVVMENYNIADGQWWPFVLLFIFLLPFFLNIWPEKENN